MSARKSSTAARAAAEDSVSDSWDRLTDRLDQLRNDLSDLSAAARDFARAGVAEGQDRVQSEIEELAARAAAIRDELNASGHRIARQAGEQAGHYARELESTINRNPITAMLVALGIGFVISMSSRGRH